MRSRARRTFKRTRSSVVARPSKMTTRAALEPMEVAHADRPPGRPPGSEATRSFVAGTRAAGGGAFDDVGDELRERLAGGVVEGSRRALLSGVGQHLAVDGADQHLSPAGIANELLANLHQVRGRNHDNNINVTCCPCFAKSKCED